MNAPEPDTQACLHENPDRQPEHVAMRAQMRRLMEARIDALPEVFRSVFMLRAVEELSVEEVAEALNVPQATVRTRFFRARSLLREGLSRDIDVATADAFCFDGARCDRIVARVLAGLATHHAHAPAPTPGARERGEPALHPMDRSARDTR